MSGSFGPGGRAVRGAGAAASLAVAGALLASVVLSPPPVPAQETAGSPPAPPPPARDGGWLGVGLVSVSECRGGPGAPEDGCRHTLVVGGLVHGGPAHRAGLAPGDTLVAVDGTSLADGLGDGIFRKMSPGDTVSLLVGRSSGRVEVEVAPASRPDSLAIVRYHGGGGFPENRTRYLLAIPEPAVLDSLRRAASREANFSLRPRVSVVPAERVREIPLGPESGVNPAVRARERLAEMQARAREFQRRAFRETRELRREMTGEMADEMGGSSMRERLGEEEWKRWVSEELQPRLQVIYDSVLAEARQRMDSLRSVYPDMGARVAEAMDSLYPEVARGGTLERARPPSPPRTSAADRPELPPSPEELGMPGNRIAGAELQPLNPGLAEFFGGTERGLVVLQVLSGTPAYRLGLRPGDVIVEAGGHRVSGLEGLRHALMEHSPVEVRWLRRGQTLVDTLRH